MFSFIDFINLTTCHTQLGCAAFAELSGALPGNFSSDRPNRSSGMFQFFASRSTDRAATPKLACEQLDDRIVPAILLNEVVLNPPGTTNEDRREFIELRNTNTTRQASDLNGLTLLVL